MAAVVDILLVNWNSRHYLQRCLSAVQRVLNEVPIGRVVVVDNASSDDSLQSALTTYGGHINVVRNASNVGFAAACNQAAADSTADFLVFLNPDTEVRAGALAKCVRFMESKDGSDVGICGIQLLDERGTIARTCARFPSFWNVLYRTVGLSQLLPSIFPSQAMREWDHRSSRRVDQVIGAFFFVRTSLFKQLGGFDPQFFVYYEEVDFSLRAKQLGWSSQFLSDAQTYHKGGGVSEQFRALRLYHNTRSKLKYVRKHFAAVQSWTIIALTLIVEPLVRLLTAIAARRDVVEVLRGYALLYRNIATEGLTSKRRHVP